jgi:hypothetical protein
MACTLRNSLQSSKEVCACQWFQPESLMMLLMALAF